MALIDKAEIAKHREISRSVRDDKINPYIEDAEALDLKPLLGKSLYYDLVANEADAKYLALLGPVAGKHQGLKKVLSLFANARYRLHGSFTDTSFGFVEKTSQDSQPVSGASRRDIYQKDRQAAHEYFSEVVDYLNENAGTYEFWGASGYKARSSRGGLRISKISK